MMTQRSGVAIAQSAHVCHMLVKREFRAYQVHLPDNRTSSILPPVIISPPPSNSTSFPFLQDEQ